MRAALSRGSCGFALPAAGSYAAGLVFLPTDPTECARAQAAVAELARQEGLDVLGWRDVPHDATHCGTGARATMPRLAQLFVAASKRDSEGGMGRRAGGGDTGLALDRRGVLPGQRAGNQTGRFPARPLAPDDLLQRHTTGPPHTPSYPHNSPPAHH